MSTTDRDPDTATERARTPGRAGRGWRDVRELLRPRHSRRQLAVAVLCGVLAFALVTQVQLTAADNGLGSARQDDLIGILNDLTARGDRLRSEVADLEATEQRLATSTDQSQAALDEARKRVQTLGILAGTVAAKGPGITLRIDDPKRSVHADVLVDAMQELRDAGAEAMQLGDDGSQVRLVASSYVVESNGAVVADGQRLHAPYTFTVIGDPRTLAAALAIPGGVLDTIERAEGASATVTQSDALVVSALRGAEQAR